jgi:hypothetical protein
MTEHTMAKRRLGTSHWDRKLVANMVALSVSDNYEDAHQEWIATGDVWWRGRGDVPSWIQANSHPHECLCGHKIVYHFRIQNTENGNEEVVGSDHINSYLIIRAIARETGINANEITEEQIQKWLNVRVKGMKAEAWWKENGEAFERMFNAVKEADLRYNTRVQDWTYDSALAQTIPVYTLIKKKTAGEEMASIVWRWNHPNNSRAQINSRGYPNDSLMRDLSMFYIKCLTGLNEQLQNEKATRQERIAERERVRQARAAERAAEEKRKQEEREEYQARMRPIWEQQARESRERAENERRASLERRKIEDAKQRQTNIEYLKIHGSKSDEMLEYYGLKTVNWMKVDRLNNHSLKTLVRYLANIKTLTRPALVRINEIAEEITGDEEE